MPAPAATQPSIKLDYSSAYRGGTKIWSQRFHFTGGALTTSTFNVLADALRDCMKDALPSVTTIVDATGYNPGSDVPAFSKPVGVAGTYPDGPNWYAPLEMCALWRFTTDQRTTKNHPIYLYKWVHAVMTEAIHSADQLRVGLKASQQIAVNQLVTGLSDGSMARKYCGPRGAVAQSGIVETYLHGHDFPR